MTASIWLQRLACIFLILAVNSSISLRAENEQFERFAQAVSNGDLNSVNEMLAAGFDPNTRVPSSDLNYTPLFLAVRANQTAVTEALLKAGADPSITDNNGDPVMVHAAKKDRKEHARLLIQHGVSIDSRNQRGITALMRGARYENAEDIQAKIDLGANPELTDDDGLTALMIATQAGNTTAMETLLQAGAKPDAFNKNGETALMQAFSSYINDREEKILSIVNLLIKNGANINLTNPNGANVLILALDSYWCPLEVINAILDEKPDINHPDKTGRDALFYAMSDERTRGLTNRLLELGADLKTKDRKNVDLLMMAVYGNDLHHVKSLLDHGLSPKLKTDSGETAVHYALRGGRRAASSSKTESPENTTVEILKLLHKKGATLTSPDTDGNTPLHLAARSGQATVFAYLLPFYENPEIKNQRGETPLHLAATLSGIIVDILLTKYPDPDVRDLEGRTAFMNASVDGYQYAQLSLLKAGANIDAINKIGVSALDDAVSDNNPDKIRFLIKHGTDPKKLRDPNSQFLRVSRLYHDELVSGEQYADLVEILAEITNDINARDSDKMTALMWVAASNNTAAIQAVLKRQPDLNARSPDGRTAIMWAACSRAESAMEILQKSGADASLQDPTGRTAEDWQAWSNQIETKTTAVSGDDSLLIEGLTIGRRHALQDYLKRHDEWNKNDQVAGMPPLHLAAALGDIDTIVELIKRGAPLDQREENHFTPLMTAAANGESDAAKYLLEQGADPSLSDTHGNRAIHLAVNLNHTQTARLFIRRESPFSGDQSRLIAALVRMGDEALLKETLESGASISENQNSSDSSDPFADNRRQYRPEAPIVAAAEQKDSKMLRILFEHAKATGVDEPNLMATALHTAARNGRLENVKFLIEECNADLDSMLDHSNKRINHTSSSEHEATKPVEGYTALSLALEEGHLKIVRYLIGKGAIITGRTYSGDTPLSFLIKHHQHDLLEYLLKNNASPDLLDLGGETALHSAAAADDEISVRLLLDHGADPGKKNTLSKTPLEMARMNKAEKTIALLEKLIK